jgi:surface protein
MFAGCSSLEKIDLSYFDSSSIKYMDFMFADCSYLKEINLDNWNTRSVRTMNYKIIYSLVVHH